MKQIKHTHFLLNQNSEWLANLASGELAATLLSLIDEKAIYIIDENQQVIYWSQGMEALTGISQSHALGNAILKPLEIAKNKKQAARTLEIPHVNGGYFKRNLESRILHNKLGAFAGGIGVLFEAGEAGSQVVLPRPSGATKQNFHGILSRSPAMRSVFQIIQNAAETEATVLVRGESGSGKELVAKAIHTLSARREAPFLAVNCAALSSNLLESELFGHARGAFTGAIKDHDGLFKRANGGTLFLDEVAEMPLELQAKLLRVIQERNYVQVGGNRTIDVDVRIVAATHRSLREEVKLGHFREDLMYRLRVVPIFLPPLRERREDISLLIWHFINMHNNKRVRVIEKIDPEAMKVLLDYPWPGNVRELHNVVEYAFAVGRGPSLRLAELPPEFREPRPSKKPMAANRTPGKLREEDEAVAIQRALAECQGRAGAAATLLGMSRATFWRKRKQHKI